jgi:hypothetical protein
VRIVNSKSEEGTRGRNLGAGRGRRGAEPERRCIPRSQLQRTSTPEDDSSSSIRIDATPRAQNPLELKRSPRSSRSRGGGALHCAFAAPAYVDADKSSTASGFE